MAGGYYTPRYWIHDLAASIVYRGVASAARLLTARPSLAENEVLRHFRWMVKRGFVPTLLMAFLYGMLAAYFPASYLGNPDLFREWIMPHFGGFFVSFLVPFAVANLFCVRGVVAIAADLTGMRLSQEIDILDTLGVDVARQLFAPRALALVLLAPVLAILGVGFGALGCYLGTSIFLPIGIAEFWREFMASVTPTLYLVTVIKAAAIAFVLAIIAGSHAFAPIAPGSRDIVGRLTTKAVAVASLGVTVLNLLFRMATS